MILWCGMRNMASLDQQIEAILFTGAKPYTVKRLADVCGADTKEIKEALEILAERLKKTDGALVLVVQGSEVELVTSRSVAETVKKALKDEISGELTKPSLEALAVLAYRGPMTRPELEQIRGVQCSLILRNLMLRGLVEMKEDARLGQPLYSVTLDFLKHIGFDRVESLPDFKTLHANPVVLQALEELNESEPVSSKSISV